MKVSIVIPCYNEEEALPLFKARMDEIMAQMEGVKFELLLVDDGSKDRTLEIARDMTHGDNRVRVLSFSRNFGKEAALLAGLVNSTGDYVAVMDADLQDPPELLIEMMGLMEEKGYDCVATRRVTREGEPPVRSMFARLFYKLINMVSSTEIVDGARDFRLMRREMVNAILRMTEKRRFSKGIFSWVGFDVHYIAYENVERVAGVTKWSFWSLLTYALEGFFSFSDAPLSLPFVFSVPILIAWLVLMILGLWVPAAMCGVTGLILMAMGVSGQYVARIYAEVMKRPLYILKDGK